MEKYKKTYKSNKLEIITTILNNKFELLDESYSASDIQDYFEYITKKKTKKRNIA